MKKWKSSRQKGALERLLVQKEKFENEDKKIPKRILKEIRILEEKLKY